MPAQTRFEAGKSMALLKTEIQEASARITRRFKAGQIVDTADIETIKAHASAMEELARYWNEKRLRELNKPVKTD